MSEAIDVDVPDAPPSDGFLWTCLRTQVKAGTSQVIGVLEFPWGGADESIAILGAIGVQKLEDVHIWCPHVAGRWVPIPEFTELTKTVRFAGPCPIWAKNTGDVDAEVLVRFRFVEGAAVPSAPDVTPAYYASNVWKQTTWFGTPVLKTPMDLWVMQEIIHDVRPTAIIETGTFMGGSAAYFGCMLDALGVGRVVTIDVEERPGRPTHPRVTYLKGSSVDIDVWDAVEIMTRGEKILVVLDSDHSYSHVLAELHAYAALVSEGSYLVVEDMNTPGPAEAVRDFLASPEGAGFRADRSREKFGTSFNQGGWLRRIGQ